MAQPKKPISQWNELVVHEKLIDEFLASWKGPRPESELIIRGPLQDVALHPEILDDSAKENLRRCVCWCYAKYPDFTLAFLTAVRAADRDESYALAVRKFIRAHATIKLRNGKEREINAATAGEICRAIQVDPVLKLIVSKETVKKARQSMASRDETVVRQMSRLIAQGNSKGKKTA